ncbi:hypothetical protein EDEG_03700 [Edhazardia aedis USNM 41457]|uniref:Glucosamine 6-phosphate N-acetyltransferase n=1 Tax=Edhazardia aedis (strain USNM 41457) TaxID=1003232 RepID=J9DGS3_EDHAE|nr:hypothetical protein EDEG_03700 [Edhazardia aedis USNM 41457]|eukprot:EJW01810.1 hypothetical protein EDEG_03700 [Edhazardia aedis USNM 41457]
MESKYRLRNLQKEDFDRGYIQLLSQLTTTGQITKEDFNAQFEKISKNRDYIIRVVEDTEKKLIVATGTLLIEHKFIHGCACMGHIEDIVVNEEYRGKNLGKKIIDDLIQISKEKGSYKTILCCDDKVVPFYRKCGLEVKEKEMVVYHNK